MVFTYHNLAVQVEKVRDGDVDDEGDEKEDQADHPQHREDHQQVRALGVQALLLHHGRVALQAAEDQSVHFTIGVKLMINTVARGKAVALVVKQPSLHQQPLLTFVKFEHV